MLDSVLRHVLFMADEFGFRFVPAAGVDWVGDWDKGKQPLRPWEEASSDPVRLNAWAVQYPRCNWWLYATGGLCLLDVDPRHGGDVLLRELEARHGPLPRTPKARTGGGGWHYYFACDNALSLKQDLCGNSGLTLICGGKGGVIVPPCRHKDGGLYTWEAAVWDVGQAALTAQHWLIDMALAGAKAKASAVAPTLAPRANADALAVPHPKTQHGPMTFIWGGGDGLSNHPGESEGQRHKTLCILLGRELGRGRSPEELESELLAWADRCKPPMPHHDALRQLKSLSRKHEARAEQQNTPHTTPAKEAPAKGNAGSMGTKEVPPLPPNFDPSDPAMWMPTFLACVKQEREAQADATISSEESGPTPFLPLPPLPSLPSHSFSEGGSEGKEAPAGEGSPWLRHGLVGRIAQAVGSQVEGSVEPIVVGLLSCLGSAIGPGPFLRIGADRHRGNIFATLVAPSGVGKSEPWAICSTLMEYADPEWFKQSVAFGLGSGEGLIERLEQVPVAFAIEAEFGSVLTKARREGSTLGPTLCCAWDGRRLEVNNRDRLSAEGHLVSAWANITDAELGKRLTNSLEAVNGFGNRFLWLRQRRVRHLPFGGDLRCLQDFAQPLREAIAKARGLSEVQWSEEAKPIWADAYPKLCASQEEHWALGRARSQALRLTLIYALIDGSDKIMPEHVRAGLSAWAWAEASAKSIFGVVPEPEPKMPTPGTGQFVWGGAGAEGRAKPASSAPHQAPVSATAVASGPTPGGASAEAVPGIPGTELGAKALARITAQHGIGKGELARSLKAKAQALADALAGLHAQGLAHPRPKPGKGRTAEGWWPGPGQKPEPEAEQQPTHPVREGAASPGSGKGTSSACTLTAPVQEGARRVGAESSPAVQEAPILFVWGAGPERESGPEPMAEAEFFAGLEPELPALPSPVREAQAVPHVGQWGFVVGPKPELAESQWRELIQSMSQTPERGQWPTPTFQGLQREELELLRTAATKELERLGRAERPRPDYRQHVEFVKAQAEWEETRRERMGFYDEPMAEAEFFATLRGL